MVGDKALYSLQRVYIISLDADNDTTENREALEDFELPDRDVQKADDAEVVEDRNQEQFFASRSCESCEGREVHDNKTVSDIEMFAS